jgi:hypothetical protein
VCWFSQHVEMPTFRVNVFARGEEDWFPDLAEPLRRVGPYPNPGLSADYPSCEEVTENHAMHGASPNLTSNKLIEVTLILLEARGGIEPPNKGFADLRCI